MKKFTRFFKFISLVIGLSFAGLSSSALPKEHDLDNTVSNLMRELSLYLDEQEEAQIEFDSTRAHYWNHLNALLSHTEELSLVLYSQQMSCMFGEAHSNRQVNKLCREFERKQFPFAEWKALLDHKIERRQKLRSALEQIKDESLSETSRIARDSAILICDEMIDILLSQEEQLREDAEHYEGINQKMAVLRDFTESRYAELRERIFLDGGESYGVILENLGKHASNASYMLREHNYARRNISGDWNQKILELTLGTLLALIIAWGLCFAALKYRYKNKKHSEEQLKKIYYYTTSLAFLLCTLFLLYARFFILEREFLITATTIAIEYFWLIGIILLSICIRISADKVFKGLMLYLPMILTSTILIVFRILLAPNEMVDVYLTPFLFLILIFNLVVLIKYSKDFSRSDTFYSWMSFLIILAGFVIAFAGYRFMALQLLMLWMILLTAIQTLICLRFLIGISESKYKSHHDENAKMPWFYTMMDKLVIPILTILMFIGSFIWASHIFDMSAWFIDMLKTDFIAVPEMCTVSVFKLVGLLCLGIAVHYFIFIMKEIIRSIYGKENYESGAIPVGIVIGSFVVWFLYVCVCIHYLKINYNSLLVAVGGLSMGIGFALKDTIDNLFCGFSLMLGNRLRVGDTVECDGIRGTISHIGYRTTTLETTNGAVISFSNNQLFSKNFKNLTKNHHYELVIINVGVAYGTNIEQARQLILNVVRDNPNLQKGKQPVVNFTGFGDNSLDLALVVWVHLNGKGKTLSNIREEIYKTFEKHDIDIPFPQRDVYVHQIPLKAEKTDAETDSETEK